MESVLARARSGEEAAFSVLYQSLRARVFGLCRKMLREPAAAADATAEVFIKVQRGLGDYDSTRPFDRWLLAIASHHCLNVLKRSNLERRIFDSSVEVAEAPDTHPAGGTPLEHLLSREQEAHVTRALDKLPERSRAVLLLRYSAELSYDEIATQLDISRENVAVLLFRAKKQLRVAVQQEEEPS